MCLFDLATECIDYTIYVQMHMISRAGIEPAQFSL